MDPDLRIWTMADSLDARHETTDQMLPTGPASRDYAKCVRGVTVTAASVLVTALRGRFCKTVG